MGEPRFILALIWQTWPNALSCDLALRADLAPLFPPGHTCEPLESLFAGQNA